MSEISDGEKVISAVILAAALDTPTVYETGTLFIWKANAPEQIEAALAEMGLKLTPI